MKPLQQAERRFTSSIKKKSGTLIVGTFSDLVSNLAVLDILMSFTNLESLLKTHFRLFVGIDMF